MAIDVDRERRAVILTLRSGTRLIDRLDRIDVVSNADDVAVDEMTEAVRRRGWDAVEVYGDLAFRRATALRLQLLEPPVAVADSPLTEVDDAETERLRRARAPDSISSSQLARTPPEGVAPLAARGVDNDVGLDPASVYRGR